MIIASIFSPISRISGPAASKVASVISITTVIAASTIQFRRGGLMVATLSTVLYGGLVLAQYLAASGLRTDPWLISASVALPPVSVARYTIVDLSGALRERQRERLAPFGAKLRWIDTLPDAMTGVIVGNEVLDAMPVQLIRFDGHGWHERGVAVDGERFVFRDKPTALRPPHDGGFAAHLRDRRAGARRR